MNKGKEGQAEQAQQRDGRWRVSDRVKEGSDQFAFPVSNWKVDWEAASLQSWRTESLLETSSRTWWMQSAAGVRGSPSPSRCGLPEEDSNCGWFSSSSASGNHNNRFMRLTCYKEPFTGTGRGLDLSPFSYRTSLITGILGLKSNSVLKWWNEAFKLHLILKTREDREAFANVRLFLGQHNHIKTHAKQVTGRQCLMLKHVQVMHISSQYFTMHNKKNKRVTCKVSLHFTLFVSSLDSKIQIRRVSPGLTPWKTV